MIKGKLPENEGVSTQAVARTWTTSRPYPTDQPTSLADLAREWRFFHHGALFLAGLDFNPLDDFIIANDIAPGRIRGIQFSEPIATGAGIERVGAADRVWMVDVALRDDLDRHLRPLVLVDRRRRAVTGVHAVDVEIDDPVKVAGRKPGRVTVTLYLPDGSSMRVEPEPPEPLLIGQGSRIRLRRAQPLPRWVSSAPLVLEA